MLMDGGLWPRQTFLGQRLWAIDALSVGVGSFLVALAASVSIKLPFTPIPITLAPQVCLALGIVLGKNRGLLAVLAYLMQGALGIPVFALGGLGLLHLVGPRGGYLLGYLVGTYVTGYLVEHIRQLSVYRVLVALLVGTGVIYVYGLLQLSLFVGPNEAVICGLLPFLIVDAIKILAVSQVVWRFLPKSRGS